MNKTQKGAWYVVLTSLLCLALGIYMIVEIAVLRRVPEGFGRYFWLPAFLLITGISIYFIRKKQSPSEVDSDERDDLIKKRATLMAFVSVWILLLASSIIPRFILGPDGSIPVWILPIINAGLLLVVLLIHETAVLIQYGRESTGEKS